MIEVKEENVDFSDANADSSMECDDTAVDDSGMTCYRHGCVLK